jgi:uncharacterized membrane protein YoaK (UPF0700 family)
MSDKSRAVASPAFAVAVGLAALAGWVDAVAYVRLARTYVSFMSGNSTTLAASLSVAHAPKAPLVICVLAAFVGGVILGECIAIAAGRRGHAAALLAESLFLFAGMGAAIPAASLFAPAILLAIALGIQNTSIQKAAGMHVALTYVTGTLVRFGRAIAHALAGQAPWHAALPYLLLWLGMIGGAAGGAALARISATLAIAAAAVAALLFAGVVSILADDG